MQLQNTFSFHVYIYFPNQLLLLHYFILLAMLAINVRNWKWLEVWMEHGQHMDINFVCRCADEKGESSKCD